VPGPNAKPLISTSLAPLTAATVTFDGNLPASFARFVRKSSFANGRWHW